MRTIITILILAMLGTIGYLVIGRDTVSTNVTPHQPETPFSRDSRTEKRSRTPHLVRTLIDPTKHLDEQIEAIRALPSDLTDEEFVALIDLLYDPAPETISRAIWSTLQNEVMEVLRHSRFDFAQYPSAMATLLADKGADPIMRDYAAQHLTLYLADRAQSLKQETVDASLQTLIDVLHGSRESVGQVTGTTLMALCDLNHKQPELLKPHRESLASGILYLLNQDNHVSLSNRIAAIQSAGRLEISQALPIVRQMARSEETKTTFKISSIAALGYFADPADRSFLEQVAQGQSKLRFAAQAALNNFEN